MATNRISAEHQIQTTETDTTFRLAPDGLGGVEFVSGGGGGIWYPLTVFDPTTGNYLPLVDGSGNTIMTNA